MQIVPASHKLGLINPEHGSGFLTPQQAKAEATADKIVYLELQAGEVALLHNHLLHSSDVNQTDFPRRKPSASATWTRRQRPAPASSSTAFSGRELPQLA